MKILLLEDDPVLARELSLFLRQREYYVDIAEDSDAFQIKCNHSTYDLYLLDINVPGMNGLSICKSIREENKTVPIIITTAYGEIGNKKQAFEYGADDYLVKPFHFEELIFRIQSINRRLKENHDESKPLIIGDLEIFEQLSEVKRNGKPIDLTPKEYQVLLILAKANGRTLSKQVIAENVWDIQFESNLNTIEVYINFLRKKIDKDQIVKLIHTRPGFGYYLKPENHDA